VLLVHLLLSIVPESICPRVPELQEEDVTDHPHVRTIHESHSANPHLSKGYGKGGLAGNRGKQPQSVVAKESNVPEVLSSTIAAHTATPATNFFLKFVAAAWTARFYANF